MKPVKAMRWHGFIPQKRLPSEAESWQAHGLP
jgi:hypothetical protein